MKALTIIDLSIGVSAFFFKNIMDIESLSQTSPQNGLSRCGLFWDKNAIFYNNRNSML
jgi:hypothetical protein